MQPPTQVAVFAPLIDEQAPAGAPLMVHEIVPSDTACGHDEQSGPVLDDEEEDDELDELLLDEEEDEEEEELDEDELEELLEDDELELLLLEELEEELLDELELDEEEEELEDDELEEDELEDDEEEEELNGVQDWITVDVRTPELFTSGIGIPTSQPAGESSVIVPTNRTGEARAADW